MHFRNEFFFLSNFYPIQMIFDGEVYKSAEHAFQAAKCATDIDEKRIRAARTPAIAKSLGRRVELISNWESYKVKIMEKILRVKFADPIMKLLLHNIKGEIVENNKWHDIYWGVCDCSEHESTGKNILGELLMLIRDSESMLMCLDNEMNM